MRILSISIILQENCETSLNLCQNEVHDHAWSRQHQNVVYVTCVATFKDKMTRFVTIFLY